VLDPYNPDTDGDGLLDGQEVKLALMPGDGDSDNDMIPDAVEVKPFDYASQDWYINPADNDTDKDGIGDGAECPERSVNAENPTLGVCRDTDGDFTRTFFDTDG